MASIAGARLIVAEICLVIAVWSRIFGIKFSILLAGAGGIPVYCAFIVFMAAFSRHPLQVLRRLVWAYACVSLATIIVMFADFYRWAGITCTFTLRDGAPATETYVRNIWNCIYLSVMTITTVGYGDCSPSGPWGRVISSVEALSGYFLLAVLANSLINLLTAA